MTALTLVADGGLTAVTRHDAGRLYLQQPIAAALDRFRLSTRFGRTEIDIPVTGRVTGDGRIVELDEASSGSVEAMLRVPAAGLAALRPLMATVVAAPARRPRLGAALLLVGLCLMLGAYVGARLYHKATTITPVFATLASDVQTIASPTSGRLAFVTDAGNAVAGEPILGVETANGRTVLIDATRDQMIVGAEAEIGARVRRGDPLLAVADGHPAVRVTAIVSREESELLLGGATARFTILGAAGETISLPIGAENIELRSVVNPAGVALPPAMEVTFEMPDNGVVYRRTPLALTFELTLAQRVEQLLSGFGVPRVAAAAVTAPLGWLSPNNGGEA